MPRIGPELVARAAKERRAGLVLARLHRFALGAAGLGVAPGERLAVEGVGDEELPVALVVPFALDLVALVVHARVALAARLLEALERVAVRDVAAAALSAHRGRGEKKQA